MVPLARLLCTLCGIKGRAVGVPLSVVCVCAAMASTRGHLRNRPRLTLGIPQAIPCDGFCAVLICTRSNTVHTALQSTRQLPRHLPVDDCSLS